MKPLAVEEIFPWEEYEKRRAEMRKHAVALRELRRFELSDSCVVVFENRDTVQFQVQEMLRVDRDDSSERIALELSCFNLLIPGANELSATLIIRVPEYREVDNALQKLNGITRQCISLNIGGDDFFASFDVDEETLVCDSDVFYIRFTLSDTAVERFLDPTVPVRLLSRHARCQAEVLLDSEARNSLSKDLQS